MQLIQGDNKVERGNEPKSPHELHVEAETLQTEAQSHRMNSTLSATAVVLGGIAVGALFPPAGAVVGLAAAGAAAGALMRALAKEKEASEKESMAEVLEQEGEGSERK